MSTSAPRRRLACTVCTRRKVKCDKETPCSNCIKRGVPHNCDRESEQLAASPGEDQLARSLGREHSHIQEPSHDPITLGALLRRVADLEATIKSNTQERYHARPTGAEGSREPDIVHQPQRTSDVEDAGLPRSVEFSPAANPDIEDAATILEFLAWGRMKDPEYTTVVSPEAERTDRRISDVGDGRPDLAVDGYLEGSSQLPQLQILLPSHRLLVQLVEYHNECLLWFHGSFCASSFRSQVDDFYQRHKGNIEAQGIGLQWIALLFAVLAGTITSAPDSRLQEWGIRGTEQRLLSQKWYRAVISCLNRAEYTAHHSIYSVQARSTLTSSAHILGESNSQSVHLAAAVRIAQSLGLHRLSGEIGNRSIEQETGRRVWAQLCTQDWFGVSFSETYLINPLNSRSEPPRNCHDHDMVSLDESVPTITSYNRFLNKIASIMPSLQDGMTNSNTLYTKYDQVLMHDKKMRTLATAGRPIFLSTVPLDSAWPIYIPWARRALAMSSSHKIIMIHRKFLASSFTNPAFTFTRRTCLAASKTILREYKALVVEAEDSPILWSNQAFSVAACIIICLDLLHQEAAASDQDSKDAEYRQLVVEAVEILSRSQHQSMIASRGVRLLNALLREVDRAWQFQGASSVPGGDGSRKRKTQHEIDPAAKRPRHLDIPNFVKAFREGFQARTDDTELTEDGVTTLDRAQLPVQIENSSGSSYGPTRDQREAPRTGHQTKHADLRFPSHIDLQAGWDPFDGFQATFDPFENLMFLANNDVSSWV